MATKKTEILIRVQPELKEKAQKHADSKKWSLSILGETAIKFYLEVAALAEEQKLTPDEYIENCGLDAEEINDLIMSNPTIAEIQDKMNELNEFYEEFQEKNQMLNARYQVLDKKLNENHEILDRLEKIVKKEPKK